MRLDPKLVRDQITNLLVCYPELEEDEILRGDMIEGETNAKEFLSRVVRMIGETEAQVHGLADPKDGYIKTLKDRLDRFDRRIGTLRKFIKQIMDTANLKKLELDEATLSIRNGSPKVIIIREEEIPDRFMRIKREPNKTLIKEALVAGENVEGAALSNSETTLAILIR